MKKHFDEAKHKRGPKGSPLGGKFVKKSDYAGEHVLGIVDTARPKEDAVYLSDEAQFWVDPKGVVIQVDDHNLSASDILNVPDDGNQTNERTLIGDGFVRLKYAPGFGKVESSTNIHTLNGSKSTLRKLQSLVDDGIIELDGRIYWEFGDMSDSAQLDTSWVEVTASEFMVATRVRKARGAEAEGNDYVLE
jgi:hypothetical protein